MSTVSKQQINPSVDSNSSNPLIHERRKRVFSLSRRASKKNFNNMAGQTVEIPEPPRVPFLGHVTDIDMELPMRSFVHLAEKYGRTLCLERTR